MARSVMAVNSAAEAENRMHGEEARRFGFAGGLVPGVDVLGYLAHEAMARWGPAWLGGGRLEGRLVAPVYDGERVRVEVTGRDGAAIEARVAGDDGGLRARSSLALLGDGEAGAARVEAGALPGRPGPAPEERPRASRPALAPGTVLGTLNVGFHAGAARAHLDQLGENHPAFRSDGLAHPAWLLGLANWVLSATVALGPWIHVSSDARLLGVVGDGARVEVRGVVTDRFERSGHEFVDLRAGYRVAGTPVGLVDHRAIWRPRGRDPQPPAG